MGLFDSFFKNNTSSSFKPNFSKSEYDNWINFLDQGGTDKEWKSLKRKNNWSFPKSSTEIFAQYQKEFRPVFDQYSIFLQDIKSLWSILYHSKDYHGKNALVVENKCLKAISYYKKIREIDLKYEQETMNGSPAFTKLALLYERRKEYEKAMKICKEALSLGMDESARLLRLAKKSNRALTEEEAKLVENVSKNGGSLTHNTTSKNKKTNKGNSSLKKIPSSVIDSDQRTPASKKFAETIYKKYYSDYPVKPFISRDRERNTNWLEESEMFPAQSVISKSMMTRYSDGLLPGHIYMLYWIDKIHRKRIPVYFEYEFGIDFEKEKLFLIKNGYLSNNEEVTKKGFSAISKHYSVIENKK